MKTAESYLAEQKLTDYNDAAEAVVVAMKNYAADAIRECAEQVDNFVYPNKQLPGDLKTDILSLIKELK